MSLTSAQKLYLSAYYYRQWLGAGVVLGIWYILAPTPGEIILPQCEPDGTIARISERADGATFWRTQLPYVEKQLSAALNWDSDQASANARDRTAQEMANAYLERTYVEHPELAPSIAQRRADQLRAAADAIEDAENSAIVSDYMKKQAAAAQACKDKILAMK